MKSHIPGYGYLEIKSDKPTFVKVEDWRPFEAKGGKRCDYKRSTRKRKTHKKRKHTRRRL
jgi:hypothetical protein